MSFGYTGNILRINLTTSSITVEHQDEAFYKKYLGGRNVAAYYMLKEIPVDTDPLSPENKLIATTSVITGTPLPGSARHTLAAKSPLTGGFGDSEAGGYWGPELKFAGYDTVIVEGRSDKPVYIMIKDQEVQILDAAHLWGKDTGDVEAMIREDQGDKKVRVLQTGVAGERLARFAAVTNELKHWNGRCGLGAVMGSKNLRAIAVRGSKKVEMADKKGVIGLSQWFAKSMKKDPGIQYFSEIGTSAGVDALNGMGLLPTRNFKQGQFEEASEMTGEKMHDEILVKREACYACPVRCKRVVEVTEGPIKIDKAYGGPEFETIGAMGSACGIGNLKAVSKANELCGRYGLDTISTGMTIAWAMECYERGLITDEMTRGLKLNFGNADSVLELIRLIAFREGFGDVLAEGSYRAGEAVGNDAVKYSMTTRRQEFAAHEPRGKWNIGFGYAVSVTGADHLVVAHDHAFENLPDLEAELGGMDLGPLHQFGITKPMPATSLSDDKMKMFSILQPIWSLYNVLDLCIFVGVPERKMFRLHHLQEMVNNVCGWDMSFDEMMTSAKMSVDLARLFNVKHGVGAEWDKLPERMHEPLENGPYKGQAIDRKDFADALVTYYQLMGWDAVGCPTQELLQGYDVAELA